MKRPSAPIVFTSCLLLAASVFAFLTLDLSPTARRVPLLVVIPLLVLLFLEMKRDLRAAPSDGAPAGARTGIRPGDAHGPNAEPTRIATPGTERRMLLWVLALPTLVQLLGIVAGPGVFALLYFRVRSKESWGFALSAAVITAAALWAVFGVILETSMRTGIPLGGFG